jgi:hypothetical protein
MISHHTRLLLTGVGPLPPEQPERLHAPGLRLWGMARELARAGHPVRLLCADFGAGDDAIRRFDLSPTQPATLPPGLDRQLPAEGGLPALISSEAREWGADAAVSSTDVMNHALAAADLDLPIWFDFFGDPMAERQLLSLRNGSDDGLDDQWALVAAALARADRLSGCSTDQCAALLGELAAVGRLGRLTTGQRLVSRIPPWIEPLPAPDPAASGARILRGSEVANDAFLIVQTGGFNTWLDLETLFLALEQAMEANPRIHFAATGGPIPGHYAKGFEWFELQVAASPHNRRYHLLGWRPLADVPRLLAEADLAVNLDVFCAEGIMGTRNRLLDWLLAGVPTLSTPGCELAAELGEEDLLTLVPHGDPNAATRAILAAAADPAPRREAARRAAGWLGRHRTAAVCLRPLLDWTASPKPASDLQAWRSGEAVPPNLWRQASQAPGNLEQLRARARRAVWLEQKLARMEGSRWVKLALRLRGRGDLETPPDGC